MAINFPPVSGLSNGYSLTIGDTLYTLNKTSNTVYYWSASIANNPDNRYVNTSGDTMTGPLSGVTTLRANDLSNGSITKSMTEVLTGSTFAQGQVTAAGAGSGMENATVSKGSTGRYNISFLSGAPNGNYSVMVTTEFTAESDISSQYGRCPVIFNKTPAGFTVGNAATSSGAFVDLGFNFVVFAA